MSLTEGYPTAPIFRLWSGISVLASAMERKTWSIFNRQILYPNLFVVLCGVPASGKSISIAPAKQILQESKVAIIAPDDMTRAAFLDTLMESAKRINIGGRIFEHHPMCSFVPEFGTLVNAHDLEFFSTLNKVWDNGDDFSSRRRGHNGARVLAISYPTYNLLAGTQPGYLASLLPEEAWHMGLTSRLIMIHAPGADRIDPFDAGDDRRSLRAEIVRNLVAIGKLLGEFTVTDEAKLAIRLWISGGMSPMPEHPRLVHYNGRRDMHIMKLSMIAAVARGCELVIRAEDVARAKQWLLSAETLMPDIFRDMHLKSDATLMNECHRFVFEIWTKSHREVARRLPIAKSDIMHFLALRCPADKAERVLDLMESAGWLSRDTTNPQMYLPRARGFRTDEQ